ncbi:hypothetical protein GCM10023093_08130 [Nemorincola caseinilytica]|uniref:SnoaL-like domain-containing protein n=2 Tax=Nemorincola caseinilytica TaxID=2054315 RepID=A0ABP8N6E9_9BACT
MLLLAACKDHTALSERQRAEVSGEVKTMLYKYCADVKARGLHAEYDHIDNSGEFFWVPPGATAPLCFDTVISMIGRNAGMYKDVNNTFDTLVVTPLTTRLAAYSARIRSATTDTAGKYVVVYLVETGTVIKRKNGWKLLCGQTSVCPMRAE